MKDRVSIRYVEIIFGKQFNYTTEDGDAYLRGLILADQFVEKNPYFRDSLLTGRKFELLGFADGLTSTGNFEIALSVYRFLGMEDRIKKVKELEISNK